ncbi:TRAP transporter large permease subunit [Candidatus Njordibacter sp. Uisw_056]|jgi:TRAP-type mannitol/chloroaromatic compound transport system permease large subunit|uniref:TRAP transporter large permease n=1 Tax=Candidatus Njordibacter sp. Uisw_056 TaxID=3230973 RepID=UPI003D45F3D4|tara:strand:- start:209 stop:1810 length:1602 start_codon:yes stop_codon:yes gene_type:complete
MDIGQISVLLFVGMIFLLVIGMPLGFASGFLAVGVLVLKFGPDLLFSDFGSGPLNIIGQRIYGITTDYILISVPLFILMATLLERSGIARDMYSSLNVWLSKSRGGIAIVTALMAVVMAAMSGIIGGEVVLLGLIALPQMLRLGYNQNLAIGTICASGSLGTMIPPSIVLIMYGMITETSIHALFKAAFVPGFILAAFYIFYIIVRTQLNPSLAPLPEPSDDDLPANKKTKCFITFMGWLIAIYSGGRLLHAIVIEAQNSLGLLKEYDYHPYTTSSITLALVMLVLSTAIPYAVFKADVLKTTWSMTKGLIAPFSVVFIVLGSIYGGVTGITEAAAMGTVAVLILIAIRGEFSVALVSEALMRTFKSTGTILWITIGATALAGAYTIAGGPTYVANLIIGSELSTIGVLIFMMLVFLFLGAFMDWVGIVLLVMPVFLPIVLKLPIAEIGVFSPLVDDPRFISVWFGIVFCIAMQVSFLSPPFGPAAFFLKSVAPPHITLPAIFRGFLPFIGIQVCILILVIAFPELTMFFRSS